MKTNINTTTRNLLPIAIASLAIASTLPATAASMIVKPIAAAASTEFTDRPGADTLNNNDSELDTGAPIPATLPTVNVIKTDNWLALEASPTTDIVVDDQWIVFDLGATYQLDGMFVWNYWDSPTSGPTQGARAVDVLFATTLSDAFGSAPSLANDFSGSTSVEFAQMTSVTGSQGTGSFVGLGSAKEARYVLFDIDTNYGFGDGETGGVGRVGIGEVRFTTVPEPSSTALLGLGGLALILRRRR